MSLLNTQQAENARSIETVLRNELSNAKARQLIAALANASDATINKFINGNQAEFKISLWFVCRMISAFDLKIVNASDSTYDPQTHSAVPDSILNAGATMAAIGQTVINEVQENGLDVIPISIQKHFGK